MFSTMDPAIIRALIEGQPDVLSEEVKTESEFYKHVSCPMCLTVGSSEKRLRPPKVVIEADGTPNVVASPFSPGLALPQGYARCIHCGTDFDPYSGVISKTEASGIIPVDVDPAARIVAPPSDLHQE